MNYKEVTDKATITSVLNRSSVCSMVYDFKNEGIAVAEVDSGEYANARSCTASLKSTIKRFEIKGIKATTQNGKTYLINEDVDVH